MTNTRLYENTYIILAGKAEYCNESHAVYTGTDFPVTRDALCVME